MSKFPVGVVGVGHLGSLHAKMFSEILSVQLVGVADADFQRAQKIASEAQATAFSSFEELLPQVRAISIATPTPTHFSIAQIALERGVHVFIEKPITSRVGDAEKLIALAKKNKLKIQVGHIERFNPALLALEDYHITPMFIESHRLAQFNPRGADVAVVLDLMIHDIDIIMSFVNSPVEHIQANGVAVVSDTIDIANARITFVNGCVANVTASRISQKKMRKMRMFQRDEYISVDFLDGTAEVFRLLDADQEPTQTMMLLGEISSGAKKRSITYEQPKIKEVNALKYELEAFLDAIVQDKEPVVTAEEGLRALEVAHQIMEKIGEQRPVR